MPRVGHTHKSMLLRGVKFPPPVLDRADIDATKNRAGTTGRSYGGAPLRGGNGNGRGRGRGGNINYGAAPSISSYVAPMPPPPPFPPQMHGGFPHGLPAFPPPMPPPPPGVRLGNFSYGYSMHAYEYPPPPPPGRQDDRYGAPRGNVDPYNGSPYDRRRDHYGGPPQSRDGSGRTQNGYRR